MWGLQQVPARLTWALEVGHSRKVADKLAISHKLLCKRRPIQCLYPRSPGSPRCLFVLRIASPFPNPYPSQPRPSICYCNDPPRLTSFIVAVSLSMCPIPAPDTPSTFPVSAIRTESQQHGIEPRSRYERLHSCPSHSFGFV